jgi:hypothetical protein
MVGCSQPESLVAQSRRRHRRALSVEARRWSVGTGMLVGGMIADDRGISFAVDRGGRAPEVVGVRFGEMRRALRWDDVR